MRHRFQYYGAMSSPHANVAIWRYTNRHEYDSLYCPVKILYISQYFPPEMGAPAARASELARHWAQAGHEVSVLTGFPNHPTGVVPPEWRPRLRRLVYHEQILQNGPRTSDLIVQASAVGGGAQTSEVRGLRSDARIDVYRTWLWPLPNRKSHERMRNYASFCVSAALRGLSLPRPDVIIASSPQLLVGLSGWWLGFSRQIPFVFEVRDLWPESLAAVGVGHEGSLLHQALGAVAKFLYERSNYIVVVSPAFKQHLVERWRVPPGKIAIVENGVETALFAPSSPSVRSEVRRRLEAEAQTKAEPQGLAPAFSDRDGAAGKPQAFNSVDEISDRFIVSYIGTIGNAHGLETLLDAAAQLQHQNPDVLFLIIGEGAEKERVKALAQTRALANVRFIDQQPREKIPAFISASDACLVLLKKTEVFKTVIPTKMLEFMSCARPVILGVEGQARQIIEEAGAGLQIEPENSQALVDSIQHLAANRELGVTLGNQGREYILRNFSRENTARKYVEVLRNLTAHQP